MQTLNLITYLLYGVITYFITVKIGWICYRNGYHYIKQELENEDLAQSINKILLVCYYLTNLGFITLMVYFWQPVFTLLEMVESLCQKVGMVVMLLGVLHVINMSAIYLARKKSTSDAAQNKQ